MSKKSENKSTLAADTVNRILDAAFACVGEKGYAATSMNDIVRRSGISKGGAYWHFESKDEIFVSLIEREYAKWLRDVASNMDDRTDAADKLRAYGRQFFDVIDDPIFRMIPESYWGEMAEHFSDRLNRCYNCDEELLLELFTEAIESGRIKDGDPAELAWIYMSLLEGTFNRIAMVYNRGADITRLLDYALNAVDNFIDSAITEQNTKNKGNLKK